MIKTLAAASCTLFASVAWVVLPTIAADDGITPNSLQAEIEALKPAQHVWRAIDWKTCPLEALKASHELKKPIVAWVFLGIPTDERC